MDFLTFRSYFDERFFAVLQTKVRQFVSYSDSEKVASIARYSEQLAHNGKRFRPYLVYVACGMPNDSDELIDLLIAVEMVHLFALIHDDIMDEAQTRHGVSCAHESFSAEYGAKTGNSIAILLGDLIFAWSYECLMAYTERYPLQRSLVQQEFARLITEVIHGQVLDVIAPSQPQWTQELIIQKMVLKTARYSFVQPLRIGFAARNILSQQSVFAESFGLNLGIGFQLQDDLLDALPDVVTGKSSGTDIKTKQQTILSWYMHHKASPQNTALFDTYYGSTIVDETAVFQLLQESGAIDFVQNLADHYFAKAFESIQDDESVWHQIVDLVKNRKK